MCFDSNCFEKLVSFCKFFIDRKLTISYIFQELIFTVLTGILVIGVVHQLIGFVGALIENECLIITYLVLTSIIAFLALVKGVTESIYLKLCWSISLWFVFNAVVVVLFLKAMKRVLRERATAQAQVLPMNI